MMEFTVRVCVDTQDPEQGYAQLRAAIEFNGHQCYIRDTWLKNNQPLPADAAQKIAFNWQKNRDAHLYDRKVRFTTNDPGFATKLANLIDVQQASLK